MNKPQNSKPGSIIESANAIRHVFVRDLVIETEIGIHPNEHYVAQRIVINVDLAVRDIPVEFTDRYSDVVCYENVVNGVKRLAEAGHVNLVETLAERIASHCLEDPRVISARVRIEKPDIFKECAGVGVEIERVRPVK
ncbi:MAG: dihydroneopterin aldolase [Fimbriimonadaceae bacterium]|nr:dihydroneopterin aldolase [Alphaproteobacteria bacterium]